MVAEPIEGYARPGEARMHEACYGGTLHDWGPGSRIPTRLARMSTAIASESSQCERLRRSPRHSCLRRKRWSMKHASIMLHSGLPPAHASRLASGIQYLPMSYR